MAGSVNKVILIGRCGKDPEIRTTQGGDRVASFSIATSERWKDKSTGERKEKTEWSNVVVFNDRIVEVVEKFVRKGALIHVEGSLSTRKWTDKNGAEKYTTEVVLRPFRGELTLLDSAGERGAGGGGGSDKYNTSTGTSRQDKRGNPAPEPFDLDEEIPF